MILRSHQPIPPNIIAMSAEATIIRMIDFAEVLEFAVIVARATVLGRQAMPPTNGRRWPLSELHNRCCSVRSRKAAPNVPGPHTQIVTRIFLLIPENLVRLYIFDQRVLDLVQGLKNPQAR